MMSRARIVRDAAGIAVVAREHHELARHTSTKLHIVLANPQHQAPMTVAIAIRPETSCGTRLKNARVCGSAFASPTRAPEPNPVKCASTSVRSPPAPVNASKATAAISGAHRRAHRIAPVECRFHAYAATKPSVANTAVEAPIVVRPPSIKRLSTQ